MVSRVQACYIALDWYDVCVHSTQSYGKAQTLQRHYSIVELGSSNRFELGCKSQCQAVQGWDRLTPTIPYRGYTISVRQVGRG
jgi:hypothetical protein